MVKIIFNSPSHASIALDLQLVVKATHRYQLYPLRQIGLQCLRITTTVQGGLCFPLNQLDYSLLISMR